MKKLFVMAVMAVAALNANAQWWAGGSFALNFDNNGRNGDQNTTSFEIAPEVGYNLSDNWAVAIALGFGTTNNAAVSEGVDSYYGGKLDEANNYFKVAPYARYTFCKTGPFHSSLMVV